MSTETDRSPTLGEIDAWGLTHPGKVRDTNMDHFFVGSISRGVLVYESSLGTEARAAAHQDRLASLAIVADGVGSTTGGEEASRFAVTSLIEEVSRHFHDAHAAESTDPEVFNRLLEDAALAAHKRLVERMEQDPEGRRAATTLTLFLGLWPHGYLLQVGDSRCYMHREGELTQITRDQTMAQELIDQGVLTQTRAHETKWANVLSSAIGGQQAAPVVTRFTREWGTVLLLCSDGLTKHVSDQRIKERIESMENARQLCEDLLQDALDDGGTDNISIVAGRTVQSREQPA